MRALLFTCLLLVPSIALAAQPDDADEAWDDMETQRVGATGAQDSSETEQATALDIWGDVADMYGELLAAPYNYSEEDLAYGSQCIDDGIEDYDFGFAFTGTADTVFIWGWDESNDGITDYYATPPLYDDAETHWRTGEAHFEWAYDDYYMAESLYINAQDHFGDAYDFFINLY